MAHTERILDELLVLRCQDGEASAFEELVARWQRKLVRHAHHLTGDVEGSHDVVQETWFAIVRGLGRLEDPARFPAWAYRIVGNKAADWIRRRARRRVVEKAAGPEERASSEAALSDVDDLRAALRQLPDASRVVLSLHYLDGLKVHDIAAVLGVPAGTVKSRLFNARNKLKHALERKAP